MYFLQVKYKSILRINVPLIRLVYILDFNDVMKMKSRCASRTYPEEKHCLKIQYFVRTNCKNL